MLQLNTQAMRPYRTAFQSATELMTSCLDGIERMQNTQTQAIKAMLTDQIAAVKRLESATSMNDLLALQSDLARDRMEKAMAYWKGLYVNGVMNQIEFMRQAQTKAQEVVDGVTEIIDRVPAGAAAPPVVSAMKLMMKAAQTSYTAGLRATEEAALQAAAQVEAARGGDAVRQGNGKMKRAA